MLKLCFSGVEVYHNTQVGMQ